MSLWITTGVFWKTSYKGGPGIKRHSTCWGQRKKMWKQNIPLLCFGRKQTSAQVKSSEILLWLEVVKSKKRRGCFYGSTYIPAQPRLKPRPEIPWTWKSQVLRDYFSPKKASICLTFKILLVTKSKNEPQKMYSEKHYLSRVFQTLQNSMSIIFLIAFLIAWKQYLEKNITMVL